VISVTRLNYVFRSAGIVDAGMYCNFETFTAGSIYEKISQHITRAYSADNPDDNDDGSGHVIAE
jgi:hypothetical protein